MIAKEAVDMMTENDEKVHHIFDKVPMENLPSEDDFKAMKADPGMAAYLQLSTEEASQTTEQEKFEKRTETALDKSSKIDNLVEEMSKLPEEQHVSMGPGSEQEVVSMTE